MKIGDILSANAARRPDRPAVILGDRRLTFAELDARSDRLANALLDHGLQVGDRVILYVGNSVELVELIAAVWKAGGLAVPITTWIVGHELAFMVGDCKPFAVVYGPAQAGNVDHAFSEAAVDGVRRIIIGGNDNMADAIGYEDLMAAGAQQKPPPLPHDRHDALIGYTSGTTGHPKGAVTTHSNLITTQLCTATFWQLGLDDVYLVSTPIAHRVGMSRMIACFVLGVTLVVMPRFDASSAVETIRKHQVSVVGTVPTVCRLLLEEMEKTDEAFEYLKFMFATGEAFPVELKKRLFARLPQLKLISFYGITEGGVPAALLPHEQLEKPDSVGKPMPGVEIRLIDEDGKDVAPGESGEILLRTSEPGRFMVAREYFNRPEANATTFTDGWFHTGDAGRFDEDGYLYIVDRVKDMIVSGALNIYSREVEQAIETLEAVREVAVVAGPDREFGECVVAYVAPRPGMSLTEDEVIARCREQIASYKKPKYVFVTDELPRNVTGKVLKTDLRNRAAADIEARG